MKPSSEVETLMRTFSVAPASTRTLFVGLEFVHTWGDGSHAVLGKDHDHLRGGAVASVDQSHFQFNVVADVDALFANDFNARRFHSAVGQTMAKGGTGAGKRSC